MESNTDATHSEAEAKNPDASPQSQDVALPTSGSLLYPVVTLKPRKAKPFHAHHPWVLKSSIHKIDPSAVDGEPVDLVADNGKWVARGILNRASRITVRLYSWNVAEPLDEDFWRRRLVAALRFRRDLGLDDASGGARCVFSEADGLSGLIVDRFGDYFVLQPTALAMARRVDLIARLLMELRPSAGVLVRTERTLHKLEDAECETGFVAGSPPDGPVFIEEHGLRWGVDLQAGQKTGFYLDQRDNRLAAAHYARGRRVLDLFCYTGGFAIACAKLGGAREVLGVDASGRAIAAAKANAELNGVVGARFREQDGFEALDELAAAGEQFEMIVLDPPKFASETAALPQAHRAYHRINRGALRLLAAGGVLVTCSCTGRIGREDFLQILAGAAQQAGRNVRVIEQRGAAVDHPVGLAALEGEYLKCMICIAE